METKTITEQLVPVTNRNNGYTTYILPDLGVRRTFGLRETKKVPLSELNSLRYTDGGEYILKELLIVNDKTALDALDIYTEPEYFYTEKEIETLLLNGSLDQLDDALNFAPEGVIEIIKQMAVEKEIPDVRKRELIEKKTGFSINNAIMVNKVMSEDVPASTQVEEKRRKAAPINASQPSNARKAAPVTSAAPKYKIVQK